MGICRLFHQWGVWATSDEMEYTLRNRHSYEKIATQPAQERTCDRCGRRQMKKVQ